MTELETPILHTLKTLQIEQCLNKDVLTVYEGWSIKKLSEFFAKHKISGAPVVASDESLIGVVTQSDVITFEASSPKDEEIEKIIQHYIGPTGFVDQPEIERIKSKAIDYCTVNSIMTGKVFSIDSTSSLYDAYKLIDKEKIHRLFVTKSTLLVGVVTAMDILKKIVDL